MIQIEATTHKIPPFTLVNDWGNTLFGDFASIYASKPAYYRTLNLLDR